MDRPINLEKKKDRGRALDQQSRWVAQRQVKCTHKKGSRINLDRKGPLLSNGGNSLAYAVIKHQFANGDIWVICLCCGRKWKPPIRSQYENEKDFWKATIEYDQALDFPTSNTSSGSIQLKFLNGNQDDSERFRSATKNS